MNIEQMKVSQRYQAAYKGGGIARVDGLERSACPFDGSNLCIKHWWLAGWHDTDMELAPHHQGMRAVISRRAAQYAGRKTYRGRCGKHGAVDRLTASGACIVCNRLRGPAHG